MYIRPGLVKSVKGGTPKNKRRKTNIRPFLPFIFSLHSEFTFIRKSFGVEKDPIKYFLEILHFRVKLQNVVVKNENKKYIFRKQRKNVAL